jgi:hypothetical protein
MAKTLGVALTVHRRPQYLRRIAHSILCYGVDFRVLVTLSRPTSSVVSEVEHLQRMLPNVTLVEAPFNPLEPGEPERFMELRDWQWQQLQDCRYFCLHDDDHWLSDPPEVEEVLNLNPDIVYVDKSYFWDEMHVNRAMPRHRSGFLYRVMPGDTWRPRVPSPVNLHRKRPLKVLDMEGHLLDFGYATHEDRQKCWSDYRGVGKIDAVTMGLLREPELVRWKGSSEDADQPDWD